MRCSGDQCTHGGARTNLRTHAQECAPVVHGGRAGCGWQWLRGIDSWHPFIFFWHGQNTWKPDERRSVGGNASKSPPLDPRRGVRRGGVKGARRSKYTNKEICAPSTDFVRNHRKEGVRSSSSRESITHMYSYRCNIYSTSIRTAPTWISSLDGLQLVLFFLHTYHLGRANMDQLAPFRTLRSQPLPVRSVCAGPPSPPNAQTQRAGAGRNVIVYVV